MTNLIKKIFPDNNEKFINKNSHLLIKINEQESQLINLSDEELSKYSQSLSSLKNTSTNEELIVKSFSIAREASKRFLGMRHFDVQILGGLALNEGNIAEMKTGEGKTLVATLPSYLNAISNNKVHIVTVNDYLAKRDAIWMGQVYSFLGLSVGYLQNNSSYKLTTDQNNNITSIASERKEIYECDIVYGTNSEFGFDYLRDNMVYEQSQKVQKTLDFAIIDEVDNILIDEARTPLIISGSSNQQSNDYLTFANLSNRLILNSDFEIDEKSKSVYLTEEGISKAESALKLSNLYDTENVKSLHFLENSLKAKAIFEKNKDYVVNDNKVILVDEFTGRLMPGRRYSDGLHQAIEAKEKVTIQSESITQATITLQNYFRMYTKLSGMTGTATTEAEELLKIYGIEVISIPTNKLNIRKDFTDFVFKTEKSKYKAVIQDVKNTHAKGRPILIGTASIEKSEHLSKLLKNAKITHQVLNAKNHEKEAMIIAEAGKINAVTVATNMAGRGTDIILGGSDTTEMDIWQNQHNEIINLKGLYVIGTERHEARRIDNQLRGRSGRQGDPGSTRFYVSLEDELMTRFGGEKIKNFMEWAGIEDDIPIENKMITKTIENAQVKIESYNFDIRKHLVQFDDVTNTQRDIIYKLRKNLIEKDNISKIIESLAEQTIQKFISDIQIDEDKSVINLFELINQEFTNKFGMEILSSNNTELEKMKSDELEALIFDKLMNVYNENKNSFPSEDHYLSIISSFSIRIIDYYWINHLTSIENLRQGIGLQSYAQKDPLMTFKKESLVLFEDLIENIHFGIIKNVLHTTTSDNNPNQSINLKNSSIPAKLHSHNNTKKLKRNDPCPCGCGLKIKKCPNGQLILNP
ncbi:MAG: preprotein translocase subunit SecA [SAR202 cluster bacterium]|nr:preprotein translocase subunit SecA [SAR202 cluster bacterium]